MTIHNTAQSIGFQFFDVAWPTYVGNQYHNNSYAGVSTRYGDQWGNAGIVYNLGHNMPSVNDEYGYINNVYDFPFTQTDIRNAIWGIAAAGGYGSQGDWRFVTDANGTQWCPNLTGEWLDSPVYDDIMHMVDFFTTQGIEYWKMTSHNELKSGSCAIMYWQNRDANTSCTRRQAIPRPGSI